jgi:hypothetical protein
MAGAGTSTARTPTSSTRTTRCLRTYASDTETFDVLAGMLNNLCYKWPQVCSTI